MSAFADLTITVVAASASAPTATAAASPLQIPASPSRSPSIIISPKAVTAAGGSLNSLANAAPTAEKMTRISALAPREAELLQAFDKTLSSDVSAEEAQRLLEDVDEKTSLFREFTVSDMAYLSQVLTILKFSPGDVIIEAGEESSFVGIILQGSLEVRFGDVVKPIPEGSLLGELSFFEGGVRTAAVSSASPSIVGMITFNEIQLLEEFAPTVRLKLMMLFAVEGMKKMRLVNKPPAPVIVVDESPKAASDAQAVATPSRANRRASLAVDHKRGPSDAAHIRNRSRQGGATMAPSGLNLAPGLLNANAAGAADSAPVLATRNVEALFRIRMKNEQRAQQEKIERALEKKKKAEHSARTTTVIADGHRRNAIEKQAAIQELENENEDLKEYKAWAQKKHIADAKFLREKLESFAVLQAELTVQTERSKAQIRANEDLHAQLDKMVAARTLSYAETIASLEGEVKLRQTHIEVGVRQRAVFEDKLALVAAQRQADEARVTELLSQKEVERLETTQVANEQVVVHQRALIGVQDELAACQKLLRDLDERHHIQTIGKAELNEQLLQKEMLHQRVHRHLLASVDKHSALMTDLEAYKIILKHVLASWLIKNYRRRKHLKALYIDFTEIASGAHAEVDHCAKPAPPGSKEAGGATARGPRSSLGDDAASFDDLFGQPRSRPGAVGTLSERPGRTKASQAQVTFASGARIDELLNRLNDDLVPTVRTLVTDLAQHKLHWRSTSDSFFRRTVELRQQLIDAQHHAGVRLSNPNAVHAQHLSLSLASSKAPPNWQKLGTPDFHDSLETANTVARSNFVYHADEKEEASAQNGRKSPRAPNLSPTTEDDDDESATLKPLRSGQASGANSRRGSASVAAVGGATSVSTTELRDVKEKLTFFKRRCREYKETNAMLSTNVASVGARLAELEEWQRNLYAHGGPGPAAPGGQFASSGAPFLPSVSGAAHQSYSQQLTPSRARPYQSPHHRVGSSAHQPSPSATLGVGPTAVMLAGGSLADNPNPYLHDTPNSTAGGGSNTPAAPVFHIKGNRGSLGALPFTLTSPNGPLAPHASRANDLSPAPFLLQQGASQPTGAVYSFGNGNLAKDASNPLSPHPPPATARSTLPGGVSSYLQHQLAAHSALRAAQVAASPVLVFPASPPQTARPSSHTVFTRRQ